MPSTEGHHLAVRWGPSSGSLTKVAALKQFLVSSAVKRPPERLATANRKDPSPPQMEIAKVSPSPRRQKTLRILVHLWLRPIGHSHQYPALLARLHWAARNKDRDRGRLKFEKRFSTQTHPNHNRNPSVVRHQVKRHQSARQSQKFHHQHPFAGPEEVTRARIC